jgi:hypothetical protein
LLILKIVNTIVGALSFDIFHIKEFREGLIKDLLSPLLAVVEKGGGIKVIIANTTRKFKMSSAEATVQEGRPRSKTLENLPPTSLAVDKIPRRPRSRSILPEVDAPKVLMVATPEETADEYVSPTVFDTTLRIGSHQSFAYFRKQDSSPKLQRYLLYSLSKFADSSHKVNALPTLSRNLILIQSEASKLVWPKLHR